VKNQRYVLEDGSPSDYLSLCGNLTNGAYSKGLGDFIEEWSDELSYEKMSKLLSQITGSLVLSASGVQSYLERKAESISKEWVLESKTALTQIAVLSDIALYQQESKEVILLMDDVGVKAQKPHKQVERTPNDTKRLDTTVVVIQDGQQNYHYATAGIDKTGQTIYPIKQAIIDKIGEFHHMEKPIPLVAITDGARSIRITLQAIFGIGVCIILDWYHLQLKVKTLMSMIAYKKEDKDLYIHSIKELLWVGHVAQAIVYIDALEKVKNIGKQKELRDYLEKHQKEIIDYGLRKAANKTIGSGRAEKANDLVVAHRQKKKGMAWAKTGSSSLAIIKINRLNNKIAA
jgi:hypothetical protein